MLIILPLNLAEPEHGIKAHTGMGIVLNTSLGMIVSVVLFPQVARAVVNEERAEIKCRKADEGRCREGVHTRTSLYCPRSKHRHQQARASLATAHFDRQLYSPPRAAAAPTPCLSVQHQPP